MHLIKDTNSLNLKGRNSDDYNLRFMLMTLNDFSNLSWLKAA